MFVIGSKTITDGIMKFFNTNNLVDIKSKDFYIYLLVKVNVDKRSAANTPNLKHNDTTRRN